MDSLCFVNSIFLMPFLCSYRFDTSRLAEENIILRQKIAALKKEDKETPEDLKYESPFLLFIHSSHYHHAIFSTLSSNIGL